MIILNQANVGTFARVTVPVALLGLTLAALCVAGPPVKQVKPAPTDAPFPMPARDRYFELRAKQRALRGDSAEAKADRERLQSEISAAYEAMNEELQRLNAKIFGRRQAELRRRAPAEIVHGKRLGLDVLSYPRVNGSTSAHPLGVLIACRLLGADYEWTNLGIRPDGESFWPARSVMRGGYEDEAFFVQYQLQARTTPSEAERLGRIINEIMVVHDGTHAAYERVIEGQVDFALIARRPSASEQELARNKGVVLDVEPVALDAFVFIVNRANSVIGLSGEQLKDIYRAKITSWRDVGGANQGIQAYRRNRDSGSEELMRTVFMKGEELPKIEDRWRDTLITNTMMGPYHQLTSDEYGVGYSVYYYEHFMSASPYTRTLAVDGVRPTSETIRTGEYPYVTKVYGVVRADTPTEAPARRLRDWLRTTEGQAVVEESGYVALPRDGS